MYSASASLAAPSISRNHNIIEKFLEGKGMKKVQISEMEIFQLCVSVGSSNLNFVCFGSRRKSGSVADPDRKMKLAGELGMQLGQIAVWFQNRLARWKAK